ncbi:MAG: substrate-binding domain-containing protein [Microbacteriaceae bacterium]
MAAARELPDAPVDTVLMDDERTARRMARDLVEEGHQRVAFIGNIVTVSAHRVRYQALVDELGQAGVTLDPRLVRGVSDDVVDARGVAASFLELPHPPTAIVAANNRITVGALKAYADAVRAGARGESLPVMAAFDEIELAPLLTVRTRAYASDPRELGRAAARLLFDRLDGAVTGDALRLVLP